MMMVVCPIVLAWVCFPLGFIDMEWGWLYSTNGYEVGGYRKKQGREISQAKIQSVCYNTALILKVRKEVNYA